MMRRFQSSVWTAITFLVVLLSFFPAGHALSDEPPTVLDNVRIGKHAGFERMVFDLRGGRPSRITPLTEEGLLVEFKGAESCVFPEQFASKLPSMISHMTFEKEDDALRVKIMFKKGGISVKHHLMAVAASGNGSYRLVMDFSPQPSSDGKVEQTRASSPRATQKSQSNPAPLPPKSTPSPTAPVATTTPANQAAVTESAMDPLFQEADETFLAHQTELFNYAPTIIRLYLEAIKADPKSPSIPLALYRCGVTYLAVDDYKRAEECFKRVVGEYPGHPALGLAWLGVGRIYEHKKAHAEAIMAFRTALNHPLDKPDRAEALYNLGHTLSLMNSHAEALEALTKCFAEDPTYYLKKPDALRALGEAHFALQQHDKSSHYLLWYHNLQKDAPDQDLILARLAEALANQNQHEMANKVYGYLRRLYPGSEGEAIGEIRKAELLEQQDEKGKKQALEIYKSLSQKNLPPSLSRLVVYRLASWEWKHKNYERSLILINAVLSNKSNKTALDECQTLRDKVVLDWAKQAFEDKDYGKVIDLYKENTDLFQSRGSTELEAALAESYGEIRAYPNAIEMYQTLLKKSGKKNEDWLLRIARYFFLMGNMEKAVQTCEQIQSDSLQAGKTTLLASIYFAQGRYKEAVQNFDKIFQNGKNLSATEAESVLHYAESLLQVGRYEDGVSCTLNGSKLLGDNDSEQKVQLSLLRSKCHQKLKQPEKAIEALEQALPMVQSETMKDQLNYQLSGLYVEVKDFNKATERLTQLSKSSQPLWKIAAQQQLDYLQMRSSEPKVSF
jgi:tetratricopeptide (TPR) repeat protein